MKVLKRNQIIISVLALMLIMVGYMSYTSSITDAVETGALMNSETMAGIGDAKLVNSNNIIENDEEEQKEKNTVETAESNVNSESNTTLASSTSTSKSSVEEKTKDSSNNNGNASSDYSSTVAKETTATTYGEDYFAMSKLERDKMYSQMLETYQGLAESSSVSTEQKNISTKEISNINNQKNSIMIAENLVKNLGFEDVVIFVNEKSTSVIVKAEKLSESDIAQIQNIVCREIGVEPETIHISLK